MDQGQPTPSPQLTKRIVEIVIQISALVLIFGWCFLILSPFITPIMLGMIIAVTVHPLFLRLSASLRNRKIVTSALITAALLSLIIVPSIFLTDSLIDGLRSLSSAIENETSPIPPPPESTASWPSITKPIVDIWQLASDNLRALAVNYKDQVTAAGKFILSLVASISLGFLESILAVIIAGIFLVYADEGGGLLKKVFIKLSGPRGAKLAELSELTIRNVVKGVLGVAVLQAMMAGVGFFVAGVPAAGLWTFFCLIFAIIQVGVGPVVVPVIVYLFATADAVTATVFLIWGIIVMISDNILKPLLLGRGAPVPMFVVFLGAIGGFIARGFVGLFLGAVVLSLGYELFYTWATEKDHEGETLPESK